NHGKKEKSQQLQAAIVEAIRRLSFKDSLDTTIVTDSRLLMKDVAAVATVVAEEQALGGGGLKPKGVGALVRSMGCKQERTKKGYKFAVDPRQLAELIERYGLPD